LTDAHRAGNSHQLGHVGIDVMNMIPTAPASVELLVRRRPLNRSAAYSDL
jgi:hypothetical protein